MAQSFYVHIVESPSPSELLDGFTEGRALCSFLDVAGIPYQYNLAVDQAQFRIAMTDRIVQAGQWFGFPPILHLSAHGGSEGIQLCHQRDAGSIITWAELAESIRPIHRAIGNIGVCMSSCCGAHGRRMAQVVHREHVPFAWIVGTPTNIEVRDAALAFAVFYRCFQRGDVTNIIEAMRRATGIDFELEFGEITQEQYTKDVLARYEKWLEGQPTQLSLAEMYHMATHPPIPARPS